MFYRIVPWSQSDSLMRLLGAIGTDRNLGGGNELFFTATPPRDTATLLCSHWCLEIASDGHRVGY